MKKLLNIETVFCVVVFVLMIGFVIGFQRERKALLRKISDLEVRLAKSEEDPEIMYIHDSIPVYKYEVVEVDRTDYKAQIADRKLIKELQLRVKEIEAENRTLLNTRDTVFLSPLNDSTLYYKDNWVSFKYLMDSRVLDYSVRDSLSTFVSSEYRHHFLWWRWGRKGYKVTIMNHNPKSRIEYNKYIKVK